MSDNRFIQLCSAGIAQLKPYLPGKPISELERELGISGSIKLASNENPLGASPRVAEAIGALMSEIARYPDGSGFELSQALVAKHDCDPDCITLGNGSNDVLDMIARVFLGPGCESLFSQYAFAVYPISSQAVGAELVIAPAKDYGHDLQAMRERLSERTRVVWIANPNNPTGTWLKRGELKSFIADLPEQVIVVVDEAYIEYVDQPDYPDASLWLDEFPNLIVTRTFSKAYGLASLRVGYALSHPDLAGLLNRVRQPFNVNAMAQAGALAALGDQAFIRRSVESNRQGMAQLTAGFQRLGLKYIPSVGNFVTLRLDRPAAEIDQALLREGCITRPVANYGLPEHLRVSVGLAEENSRFLDALKEVLKR
ncbi:histidinol-phosphate transaminase [endosymbiont of Ridgeia piscesae]|jgi:histidinol-phosphate aminotransferase|uniref:Histidinol-phosphate aminotransferase n=1 Tax=endosymbiont of Ridgeia piscesae TaxID=54398 RepID=A0A0T5YZJ3_9GAMM|nr:histidinol-phosphate transaminase [endosymbiont of Ridgeia piscesae]KRT55963.1 histidinol-phosphate aminotransferase [endosymbiont of Ridgeia piscesae]KRT56816.1 histidinol-phosphate aminotransferase [endosymbiont of Ridgeia piscesae]